MRDDLINYEPWLEYADDDYGFATSNLDEPETTYFGHICFHYQQAAEKYLKAFIIFKKLKFRKIHDLWPLAKTCAQTMPEFLEIKDDCIFLTDFYIVERYPVEIAPKHSREEAEEAKAAAGRIGDLVKGLLKVDL